MQQTLHSPGSCRASEQGRQPRFPGAWSPREVVELWEGSWPSGLKQVELWGLDVEMSSFPEADATDRSGGGHPHVRVWTCWGPALLPSSTCNWATRLWPHSCVWNELLGLAGSLGRVKGTGAGSLGSSGPMVWGLVWLVSLSEPKWTSSCLELGGLQEVASKPWGRAGRGGPSPHDA
jgi:hypothetical protein